jgi:hypothetical protein
MRENRRSGLRSQVPALATRARLALSLLGLALAGLAAALWLGRGARAAGPLAQEGYVWQRGWDAAAASRARGAGLGGVVALAAEASFGHRPARIVELALPAAPAPAGGLGLALRLGPLPQGFAAAPEAADGAVLLARRAVARARAAGWRPSELQIDFDAAAARLADYARLVRRVRREVAPLPVTVTALPSWLGRSGGFAELAAAADGFVLQVHSLERPAGPAARLTICDPAAAVTAVERAARFLRPFRVALPTYGYVVAFDRGGRFLGLAAEGPGLLWPAGTRLRAVSSDPDAIARLVAGWQRDRPRELRGILWYRLPAHGDRLNWRWPTLRAVMAGRAPRMEVTAVRRAAAEAPLIAEIELVNTGEAPSPLPVAVAIRWAENRLLAADGVASYGVRRGGRGELWLVRRGAGAVAAAASPEVAGVPVEPLEPLEPLEPGERRPIGWLRFDRPTEVHIEIAAAPRW